MPETPLRVTALSRSHLTWSLDKATTAFRTCHSISLLSGVKPTLVRIPVERQPASKVVVQEINEPSVVPLFTQGRTPSSARPAAEVRSPPVGEQNPWLPISQSRNLPQPQQTGICGNQSQVEHQRSRGQ